MQLNKKIDILPGMLSAFFAITFALNGVSRAGMWRLFSPGVFISYTVKILVAQLRLL